MSRNYGLTESISIDNTVSFESLKGKQTEQRGLENRSFTNPQHSLISLQKSKQVKFIDPEALSSSEDDSKSVEKTLNPDFSDYFMLDMSRSPPKQEKEPTLTLSSVSQDRSRSKSSKESEPDYTDRAGLIEV